MAVGFGLTDQAECLPHGAGCFLERLCGRKRSKARGEGFTPGRGVTTEGVQCVQESRHVDDAGFAGECAGRVLLFKDGDAGWGVVEVDTDDVGVLQDLQVVDGFLGGEPVPGVQQDPNVRLANCGDEFLCLLHGVDEGEAAGGPGSLGANVFKSDTAVLIFKNRGHLAEAGRMELKILAEGQIVAGWADPGADTRDAGGSKGGGPAREVGEAGPKRLLVASEVDGEAGGTPLNFLLLHFGEESG